MTHQPSFSQAEFATKQKITRREKFLARMETLIPWTQLLAVIEPFYPKGEQKGASKGRRIYEARTWRSNAGRAPALGGWARMLMVPLGWRQ